MSQLKHLIVIPLLVIGISYLTIKPLPVHAETATSTLEAGFASGFRYSKSPLVTSNTIIRIYVTLQNQSTADILGTVRIFDNDQPIGDIPFSIVANRLIEVWIDWTATPGPHSIRATIIDARISKAGESPVAIALSIPNSSIDLQTVPLPAPPTPTSTPTESSSRPTSDQPDPPDTVGAASTTSTDTKNDPAVTITTLLAAAFEKLLALGKSNTTSSTNSQTATVSSSDQSQPDSIGQQFNAILKSLTSDLTTKNNSLKAAITSGQGTEPILTEPINALEDKTFIKIPDNKKPTKQLVYSWLISIAITILNTWWLMVVIFLIILRALYKLWKAVREQDDD